MTIRRAASAQRFLAATASRRAPRRVTGPLLVLTSLPLLDMRERPADLARRDPSPIKIGQAEELRSVGGRDPLGPVNRKDREGTVQMNASVQFNNRVSAVARSAKRD